MSKTEIYEFDIITSSDLVASITPRQPTTSYLQILARGLVKGTIMPYFEGNYKMTITRYKSIFKRTTYQWEPIW